ncbi:MAG: hypothetical protein K1Y01_02775 [Vicinamibacteria bacterium]|nr:hypothetical protein [Vicinamibacteria bacterium]
MTPRVRPFARIGALSLAGAVFLAASPRPVIPWEDLTEVDWLYELATRFSLVDSHRVHYKTPTAELATLLEARPEPEALRHLAQAQMDLGQREKALATIEKWAAAWASANADAAGAGWDEAARWAWSYGAHAQAFVFADKAIPLLKGEAQRAVANQRVEWAELQPALRDKREMQRAALELNSTDWATAYTWVDSDISSEHLLEADKGLANLPKNTPEEPALVLRARLRVAQLRAAEVLPALDAALDSNPRRGRLFASVYVRAIDQGAKSRPDEWRQSLDSRFEAPTLARLFTYFKGQERGDACLALLQQIDRRYQKSLDRAGWSLLSSLYSEIDAVPEAFRARLAAATFADAKAAEGDLVELTRLSLRAGGRPLAWGNYADADYAWVARMDPTPGFWTGGLSLLLTGQDWSEALRRLEAESIPERTFGAARALLAELVKRNPAHPDIPGLKVDIMQRHVDRGEGREALALLKEIEAAPDAGARQRAQALGILALRQTKGALAEETRLYKAQLRFLAVDGSSPVVADHESEPTRRFQTGDFGEAGASVNDTVESRQQRYKPLLDEAISRLEERDKTHRSSIALILAEMDRLPGAEGLWLQLASRLDAWNLDDELAPRYEAALSRFDDPSWWNRLARLLTRQKRQVELRSLAEKIAATFRGAALFERSSDNNVRLEIPEQPKVGVRTRLVPWGDWVALKALERFPHSPVVLHAAEGRLVTSSAWARRSVRATDPKQPAVVEDTLLAERRWAIFAADAGVREQYFASLMKTNALEAKLQALDRAASRTPVDDLVLLEGYTRLSLFEKAADAASRLSAVYPGDESVARQALQIHRSLAGLDLSHEAPAKAVVDRAVPALVDPNPFITELGELYEETGRPEIALNIWKGLLARDPRQEERIKEAATLLWDYGHIREALDVIETGRKELNRPRMLAFEAGVLREGVKDVDGAIREYLDAVRPDADTDACYCSGFENDQRSLRRLAQWMGRDRVLKRVLGTVESLKPGNEADEKTLLALWPLGSIYAPTPGLDWDADDWIDAMDQPNDPVGREEREAKRLAARGSENAGIARVALALVNRAVLMTPAATNGKFLSALESAAAAYRASAFADAQARDRFFTGIVARQAELAPTVEERLRLEIDLAQRLASSGRVAEANALWNTLGARVEALPDSASKLKALVSRAAFIERNSGYEPARASWDGLIAKYPWSLGVIEDRAFFLRRNGRAEEARQAIEDASNRAAEGHLVPLLTRLVSESLGEKDLPRASRALDRLLKTATLTDDQRLGAVSLQARLRFQQDPGFGAVAFAIAEAPKFKPELRAQVFAEVARAAFVEKVYATSVSAWIEALNRSTQRDWLKEAARAARKTGKPEVLVSFFEKQQQRSPRDVRWAVAARELRVATDNLPGGIEMARTAAQVRPERQVLWDEAVELMERDYRFLEAADFLEGWNVQRPDDPSVAGKRSELYIRAGDLKKAVAVERAAVDAFEKTGPSEEDLSNRAADAARRLWRQGQPQLAWRFLAPQGTPEEIEASGLSVEEEFQLALLNNAYVPLLELDVDDAERLISAAGVLGQYGRIENREQVLSWLLAKIFPAARADDAFLNKWWSFIENARLEAPLRFKLAQRFAAQVAGPWTRDTPADLLDGAAESVVASVPTAKEGETQRKVRTPDFDALWTAHLVRFDQAEDLAKFLAPRLTALIEAARGNAVITSDSKREPWTLWLDSAPAIQTFARGLRTQPELIASLSAVFENRRLWDRFWAIGARGWEASHLLSELRPTARVTWLSFWERPVLNAANLEDPVLVGRRNTINETSLSLGEFLADAEPKASPARTAFAERLLGPSILGEILGDDPKFTWPMFKPRTNVQGDIIETGDDRVAGRGIDTLRFPGALWGERPGVAWFALQAYSRYRAQDPSAIDVPAEWPEAGGETERALLTARLALALKGPAEALARVERMGLRTNDADLFRFRLGLLVEAGRRPEAVEALKRRINTDQKKLSEDGLRAYAAMAEDLDLGAPLSLLDPAVPIQPALLASIYDTQGAEAGRRFKTEDVVGFRAALSARWSEKAAALKAPELRVWLSDLWANESIGLPLRGLSRLGDFWPVASSWAESVPVNDRLKAIAAIDALPNTALLDALPETVGDAWARRFLMIRVRLARSEDDLAVTLFRNALASLQTPQSLVFQPIAVATAEAESGESEGDVANVRTGYGEGEGGETEEANPRVKTFKALRAPFALARKSALVQSESAAWLDQQIEDSPESLDYWGVRLEVAPAAERADVVEKLSRAYRRGDIATYRHGEIAALLVKNAKELAAPWVQHTAPSWDSFPVVERHAGWLADTGATREAASYLVEARGKALFERAEEIRAFDKWRRWIDAGASGPETWKQALRFWRENPEAIAEPLQARLKDHTFDVLSARAALRRPTAVSPQLAFLATRALRDVDDLGFIEVSNDEAFLRLRAARSLLAKPRAARTMAGYLSADSVALDLTRRHFKAADVDSALADLARIAAALGDRNELGRSLDVLTDRKWAGARALRAELAAALVEPPMVSHRVVSGRSLLYRPRDLNFGLVSQIVQADLSRRAQSPAPSATSGAR